MRALSTKRTIPAAAGFTLGGLGPGSTRWKGHISNDMTSYAGDIKPLFRERDRGSMLTHFDLWLYSEVVENEDAILARVAAGTIPCDGPWPSTRVDLFGRWISEGTPP